MSRSLKAVGPNATLVEDDIEAGDSVPGVGLYFSKRMELGRSRLTEEQIPRNRSDTHDARGITFDVTKTDCAKQSREVTAK